MKAVDLAEPHELALAAPWPPRRQKKQNDAGHTFQEDAQQQADRVAEEKRRCGEQHAEHDRGFADRSAEASVLGLRTCALAEWHSSDRAGSKVRDTGRHCYTVLAYAHDSPWETGGCSPP